MSARRTLIIIVAIAVGAVAAISTVLYVNSAQSRANNNAKLVAVYVVSKDIPKNTTGDAAISSSMVKKSSIPKQFYPATAVTDINEIKGKVTPSALASGQVLVEKQFVEPKVAATGFSTNIPANQIAVTISADASHAVAGLIVPGDKVDILGTFQPANDPNPDHKYAHFFYQNVNVIAIGTAVAPTQGSTATPANPGSGLFTLALPPDAAQRVLLAGSQGGLTLALVPPDNKAIAVPPTAVGDIDKAPALTPYPAAP